MVKHLKSLILPGFLIFLNMAVIFSPKDKWKNIAFFTLLTLSALTAFFMHIIIESHHNPDKWKEWVGEDREDHWQLTLYNPRIYVIINCFCLLVDAARLMVMRMGSPMWANHCLVLGIGIILSFHYKIIEEKE